MEVRSGFKQTDIGVIPSEWKLSTVGSEFEVKLGKMLDAEKNTGTPKPYLGNKAIQWDRIDYEDLPTVPLTRADIERFRLKEGDLLVCEGGEVGRAAIWSAPMEECYYQKALHRLRPLRDFDVRLMPALLRLWSDRGILANYMTQTSIAHLPREKFVEVPLPVPPPVEQRAIAAVLRDVNALLDTLDLLIAKKRDIKQAVMLQLLTGQTRLPGFEREWTEKTFNELFDIFGGLSASRDQLSPDMGTCYLHYGDIHSASRPFIDVSADFAIIPKLQVDIRGIGSGSFLRDGDVVFVDASEDDEGTSKHVVVRNEANIPFISGLHTIVAKRKTDELNAAFLCYCFQTSAIRQQFKFYAVGTKVKGVNKTTIKSIRLRFPVVREQAEIARILSDMDSEIELLTARLDKTRDIKQGMMQQLLTGKVRLV